MLIDIGFIVVVVLAILKGYGKGFIVAVFSFFAMFIGLAAALKLSSAVAKHLSLNGYLLPVVSFVIVFALFVFVVRITAIVIKKSVRLVLLGPADSIAGILLYVLIYLMIYSVVLFYAVNLHLISRRAQQASFTYSFIAPFGPKVISLLGVLIPFFKGMFTQLTSFFEGVSKKA